MALDTPQPAVAVDAASLAEAFKALGDANRLRCLALIVVTGRICVGDLVTVLDLPQSTVSRHLAALRRAGLVDAQRRGTWVHYEPAADSVRAPLLDAVRRILDETDLFAVELSAAASLAAGGGCCPEHPGASTRGDP